MAKRLPKLIVPGRIRQSELPAIRSQIQTSQNDLCPICHCDLRDKVPCLDHDHVTGCIRGVLCANCNQIEGKIKNLARRGKRELPPKLFLQNILAYWDIHAERPDQRLHPTHLTGEERRLRRNAKAKARRKKIKE